MPRIAPTKGKNLSGQSSIFKPQQISPQKRMNWNSISLNKMNPMMKPCSYYNSLLMIPTVMSPKSSSINSYYPWRLQFLYLPLNSTSYLPNFKGSFQQLVLSILNLFILKLKHICSALAFSKDLVHQKAFDHFLIWFGTLF